MKNYLFLVVFAIIGFASKAQGLNVKYVQIKQVYDFQEQFDEYKINSFLKHRFEDYGYTVLYDNQDLPDEVKADPCKLLVCNVTRDKSTLVTKLNVSLANCKKEVVFSSKGESRIKKRAKSHVDALRNAFEYSVLNAKK